MKKSIVLTALLVSIVLILFTPDLSRQSISDIEAQTVLRSLPNYKRPDSVDIKISLPYQNREALIDLGKHLGHLKSPVSGTSCFGTCHNISKGGHPDDILPSGGGDERFIKNKLFKKWVDDSIEMPLDRPMKDSPGFVDNCLDTTILWEAFRPEDGFVYEEQGRRGIDAHDEDALALLAENDYLSRRLHRIAYGHDTITQASVICAISAYEQTIVSNESNISKGTVTKRRGFYLFDRHCNSCHNANAPSPTGLALSGEDIGKRKVKVPKLTGYYLAPSCNFSTCDEVELWQNRLWEAIKAHKNVYPQMARINRSHSRSIEAFMKRDYTDHNLERYK